MEAVDFSPKVEVIEATPVEPAGSIGGEAKDYAPLYDRFGVSDRNDERTNRNLKTIWEWATNQAEVKEKDAILWEITRLKHRIGEPQGGSAPWSKILSYISTYNQMKESEAYLHKLETDGRA